MGKPKHSMSNPKWYDCHLLADKHLRIDVVIFVSAFGAVFPHRLAASLTKEAREHHVSVVPVLTHFDLVKGEEELQAEIECCSRVFNTRPFCVSNLTALSNTNLGPLTSAAVYTQQLAASIASQLLVYGQQHHRHKGLPISKPIDPYHSECAVS
eukprot:NODE_5944_length_541_cov_69.191057_g5196_i0.p1 GENE.NODE_5944_length_541_cov_69.191057_g5196_i0~~NODE_5944_length_541_cov_69.191057_g5196_i0.p1  ORF type:complete len:164 (+),score=46.82 NODE_5944_length_541_cov_69.191057_g5196_i0:31-492(+)